MFGILALTLLFLASASEAAHNATASAPESNIDRCQVSGNSTLDECLERFARKWDDIRKEKPQVDALVFPILAMTHEDLKTVCARIEEARDGCGSAIETCSSHEITRFVQQNFIYGCPQKQGPSLFSDQAECLLSTIAGQQQCLTLLKKAPDQPNSCSQVEQFFKCIHDEVYKSCQAKGLAALVHAIDRFGCDIKKLDARVGNTKAVPPCAPPDWDAVATCFQPLLSLWSDIRDNDTSFLDTAFPLFKFDRSDLVKMCDIVRVIRDRCFVQIQRCPGHQLPEFANAILGSACGTQQSAFFLNHDCIRNTISENEQCHPYTVGAWQAGHLKEICGRMPQYYKCLEKPVTSKCGHEATGVLAQTIRQYGCELNTDSTSDTHSSTTTTTTTASPESTVPVIITTPTPVLQPITEGVLDFAASPPSHTAQAPGPAGAGVFSQQSNLQPFLQESQLQPSFFLAAPVPAPSLALGGPETFFNPALPAQPASPDGIQPAPPAAILLEPQQAPAPSQPPLPLPEPFSIGATSTSTAAPSTPLRSLGGWWWPLGTSSTTSTPAAPTTPPKGAVVPIPTVPQLLELCNLDKRNQLRECLNPLYRRWVEVHGKMMGEHHGLNMTFPIYHYSKSEVVELCDHYASAFLRCPFSIFQQCLNDDVVYLANAIFGYVCSPQNVGDFSRYFDCLSSVVRQRTQCTRGVEGSLLTVAQGSTSRCQGAREFYSCNRWQIDQSCTSGAEKVFQETVRQFGCELPRA